jgi:hypothetical protein
MAPSATAVVGQGFLTPVNGPAWGAYLRSNQLCMTAINSCSGLDGGAGITVIVNDPSFGGGRSSSIGNLSLQAPAGQISQPITFTKTAMGYGASFQTVPYIQLNYHNTTPGAVYILQITGLVSDSTQQVQLLSGGQVIAQGTINRIQ